MTDLTITGGMVADGTGAALEQRDVHIHDGLLVDKAGPGDWRVRVDPWHPPRGPPP